MVTRARVVGRVRVGVEEGLVLVPEAHRAPGGRYGGGGGGRGGGGAGRGGGGGGWKSLGRGAAAPGRRTGAGGLGDHAVVLHVTLGVRKK